MKKLIFSLLYLSGVTRLVAWWNRAKIPILCYHSVTLRPDLIPSDPWKFHLPSDYLRQHLGYLKRRYNIVTLDEFVKARAEGRSLQPYSVVVTFDDGCRNLLTVAAPILREFYVPVTAFIATDLVPDASSPDSTETWTPDDDVDTLSWDEVNKLEREYSVQFGSHTCTHPRLTSITIDEARAELTNSYAEIAERASNVVPFLAYPHGITSSSISRLARSVGYACAVTGHLGLNTYSTDPFELHRVVISSEDDLATFASRVAGVTTLVYRIKSWMSGANSADEEQPTVDFESDRHLIHEALISCKGRTTLQD